MSPTTLLQKFSVSRVVWLSVCKSVNMMANPKLFQIDFNETLRNFTPCNKEEQRIDWRI